MMQICPQGKNEDGDIEKTPWPTLFHIFNANFFLNLIKIRFRSEQLLTRNFLLIYLIENPQFQILESEIREK